MAAPKEEEAPEAKRARKGPAFELREVQGDLFVVGSSMHLAQAVSADLAMNKGIVVAFNQKFGGRNAIVSELRRMNLAPGDVGTIVRAFPAGGKERFIFHLVTKKTWRGKPPLAVFVRCLEKLAEECTSRRVAELAMPRIGCGLDGLSWQTVRPLIERAFAATDVKVTICSL